MASGHSSPNRRARGGGEETGPFSQALARFVELVWQWVESDLPFTAQDRGGHWRIVYSDREVQSDRPVTALYDDGFFPLGEQFADVDYTKAPVALAAYQGAYCVLWEADSQGKPHSEETAEGGPDLWTDFAESLTAIEGVLSPGLARGVERALRGWDGNPDDRQTRKDRREIAALMSGDAQPRRPWWKIW